MLLPCDKMFFHLLILSTLLFLMMQTTAMGNSVRVMLYPSSV